MNKWDLPFNVTAVLIVLGICGMNAAFAFAGYPWLAFFGLIALFSVRLRHTDNEEKDNDSN